MNNLTNMDWIDYETISSESTMGRLLRSNYSDSQLVLKDITLFNGYYWVPISIYNKLKEALVDKRYKNAIINSTIICSGDISIGNHEEEEEKKEKKTRPDPIENEESAKEGEKECVVCLDRCVKTIIKPCNHCILCVTCALKIKNNCPNCRTEIESIERIYL